MSVNLLPYFVFEPFLIFTVTAFSPKHLDADSLKTVSRGTENSVIVISIPIRQHPAAAFFFKNVKGTITQTGRRPSVKINSGNTIGSKKSKSIVKTDQTGNNHRVKINSHQGFVINQIFKQLKFKIMKRILFLIKKG